MKKKIEAIDIFKAISTILVILIHVTATPVVSLRPESTILKVFILINRLAKPSVPMFIFASGFTLFYVYRTKKFNFLEFLHKRFVVILLPYLFWSCAYYSLFVYMGVYTFSLGFLMESLLLGTMVYHLYFIVIIFQFYLMFGIFKKLFDRFNGHVLFLISVVLNILFLKYAHFQYADRFFMSYLSYFSLGCYLAFNWEILNTKVKSAKVYITLLFWITGLYYSYQFFRYQILNIATSNLLINVTYIFFSIVAVFYIYYVSILIDERKYEEIPNGNELKFNISNINLKSMLLGISNASFDIYFSHPLAIFISERILDKLNIVSISARSLFAFIFIMVTVVPCSILYVHLKSIFKNRSIIVETK